LVGAGHDVDSVHDEALTGRPDPEVLAAARAEARLLLTLDRGFGDVRTYPPGSHEGIVVLWLDDQSVGAVAEALAQLLGSAALETLSGCVAVWRPPVLRVRRPSH
jgi:predicted nuclease of predicted toxin-antitoxin system